VEAAEQEHRQIVLCGHQVARGGFLQAAGVGVAAAGEARVGQQQRGEVHQNRK
jgi:hypothetical protein